MIRSSSVEDFKSLLKYCKCDRVSGRHQRQLRNNEKENHEFLEVCVSLL